MSNAKEVHIEAWVPYNWASQLTPSEAGVFAAFFLAPTGLKLHYDALEQKFVPLSNGGRLTLYRVKIGGIEAVWHETLQTIVRTLRRQECANVLVARVRDLDNRTGWETIR